MHEISRDWALGEKDIREALIAYQIFNAKQHIPTVLSALRKHKQGKLKIRHLRRLMIGIENFHFIYTAITASRSTGGMAQMYASYAIRIEMAENATELFNVIDEFIKKLKSKIPSLEEFKINFKEFFYTDIFTKHKNLIKYILQKYDCYIRRNDLIDYSKMTIEHLIPQSSSDKDNIFGLVGNLILVGADTNSESLRNKTYPEKKKILQAENYPLDTILKSSNELTEEIILKRTDHMAEVAYKSIWKM